MKLNPIPVLLYHEIGHGPGATLPSVFREHMAYLRRRRIEVLTLHEFEMALAGQHNQKKASVLITFDDGARSCLTEVLPILEEFDFHATAFLITGRMRDSRSDLGSYGDVLSWDEVRRLRDTGRFALQSHSHTHVRWPFNAAGQEQLTHELRKSRETIASELGMPLTQVTHLAWPWGRCNLLFESVAKEAGFDYQYIVQNGAVTHLREKLRLPRICCDGMPASKFERWVDTLVSPYAARLANHIFGVIRRWRHGLGYQ